ncbi:hypothetical protein DFJ58DRAFT_914527, partial [Suillus subalutaceus]|uniref:uncharacterized protein n=1 Tax=Suillus subalutaceus TaxID=48586 RepID=UPI001B86EB7F
MTNVEGYIVDACLSIVGTTWTELERATRAENAREFYNLGERLKIRLIFAAAGLPTASGLIILAVPEALDPTVLVLGKFFTAFGVISGAQNYARLRAVIGSPGALCELSRSSRFTRFFILQTITYISSCVACLLTLVDLYLWLCYTAVRSWEIVFPILIGILPVVYVILDLTS